ncbi:ABC transporter substrate-binding protein [Paenibacillus agaridevorans]|uniref:ABC transporter substrate-binding protein n=1 Tax=Paenibacillus agaridevorans TaxID=171404 RepID=UPI001BE4C09D|nr:extracellular solute-binding protein [Paenibacillus agaridevorans]
MLKKKSLLILIVIVVLMLTACSGNKEGQEGDSKGGKKNVSIAVMSSGRFLETAVQKFEALQPDIHIEIKEFLAMPKSENGMSPPISQADMEKFIQTVTTQAISGKATDLILMNDLPEDKFIGKNLLVDLNEMMTKDSSFDRGKYYQNILKASQSGDGLYVMPVAFALDLIQGNTELLKKANIEIDDKTWTWDQVKEISKKLKEEAGPEYVTFINLFSNQLLYDYIESNYSQLVQHGKANFDSDLFRDMMQQVKSLYDDGILKEEFSYDYDKALLSLGGFSSPELASNPKSAFFQKPTVHGDGQGGSFKTYFKLGMNSKSKVQQEAWEFIKFLLSDEMQASPDLTGIPLNKSVVDKKFKELGSSDNEQIESVRKLLEEAGKKSDSDFKVTSIAMEEFAAYMSGQKSAEEVSKLIQNRVTTYLNE